MAAGRESACKRRNHARSASSYLVVVSRYLARLGGYQGEHLEILAALLPVHLGSGRGQHPGLYPNLTYFKSSSACLLVSVSGLRVAWIWSRRSMVDTDWMQCAFDPLFALPKSGTIKALKQHLPQYSCRWKRCSFSSQRPPSGRISSQENKYAGQVWVFGESPNFYDAQNVNLNYVCDEYDRLVVIPDRYDRFAAAHSL